MRPAGMPTSCSGWGFSDLVGVLDDVRLYRNYAANIGFRAPRSERGCAFDMTDALRAHIAGNVVERSGAQAINVAGEWNFYHAGGDPTQIIDEHWYAKDFLTDRTEYHARPTYPLTAVNIAEEDYIDGPLENFARGALRFTAAKKTYATVRNADLQRPFTASLATRARHGQDPQPREFTFAGDDLRSPAIHAGNFLIEVYFQAANDGLLVGQRQQTGYALKLQDGRAAFRVVGQGGVSAELTSQTRLADGRWHHLIAESDRDARTLAVYVDGKLDSAGSPNTRELGPIRWRMFHVVGHKTRPTSSIRRGVPGGPRERQRFPATGL